MTERTYSSRIYSEHDPAVDIEQGDYTELIATLGSLGTETFRMDTTEGDPEDSDFIIHSAEHTFVFPPQEVSPVFSGSGDVSSPEHPHAVLDHLVSKVADPSKIEGRARVSLVNDGQEIRFKAFYELDAFAGGAAVVSAIETALPGQEPRQA